ncbi:MAG: enoyl-CoA hydratase/isomerase family protein [Anaerolineales bacterium]|nr:enoyl-CoA hydratase/isomerase family protein [Anaerolineales bacterium]
MTERQFVKTSLEDRVAVITIDHPPVNALNEATISELNAALDEALASPAVKAVVLTGGGQMAFVAGADIHEFSKLSTLAEAQAVSRQVQSVFAKIECAPKPFIAAINGVALGGGLELAMACHMRIIGDRAKVGQPEINLGIIPGWGGTQRLARLVGKAKAVELILTGDSVTAQEAYRLNLVNKVVPGGEVLKTARDLARKIAGKGALATRAALEAITLGLDQPLDGGLALEAQKFGEVVVSNDAREGAAAFLQKRQPVFKDN